ncbi:MAG: YIP1 family protein [Rickettsiales bacterium]|jgi:hypothetical protein|nr:YIP1 family protein [Rickettsiales bacterium]
MAKRKIQAKTKPAAKIAADGGSGFSTLRIWVGNVAKLLFRPQKFFKSIIVDGSLDAPIIKALVYGLIGGALTFALQLSVGGQSITLGNLFSQFITTPLIALLILFAFAGIMMLVAEITHGDRDFEVCIKGLASIFFLYPVMLVLYALAFNCTSIWLVSFITDAYILFLLYNIGVHCLKGKKLSVKFVVLSLGILLIMIYATDYRLAWFLMKNASATLSCIY